MRIIDMDTIRRNETAQKPIWKPYLWRDSITFAVGDPGLGKTTLSYAMSAAISEGNEFIGLQPSGSIKVLVLDYESSGSLLKKKGDSLGNMPNVRIVYERFNDSDNDNDLSDMMEVLKSGELERIHADEWPFDLLIIDNKGTAFTTQPENDPDCNRVYVKLLRTLAKRLHCAILLWHHPSKSLEATATRKGSGSYAWSRHCNVHINLNDADHDKGIIEIETAKNREDEDRTTRYVQKIGECEFVLCDPPGGMEVSQFTQGTYPIHRASRTILNLPGEFTRDSAVKAVNRDHGDISDRVIDKALARLLKAGLIVRGDKYGTYKVTA